MSCAPCGDTGQICCAGDTCPNGECKNGKCSPTGIWGWPCGEGEGCGEGLACNTLTKTGTEEQGICQNAQQGAPFYGASCTDSGYCSSNGSGLQCIPDDKTAPPNTGGLKFSRCGCPAAGADCSGGGQKGICDAGPQTWDPLKAPKNLKAR